MPKSNWTIAMLLYAFPSFDKCTLKFNLECLVELGWNSCDTNTSLWGLKRITKSWMQRLKSNITYQCGGPLGARVSFLLTLTLVSCLPFFETFTLSLTRFYFFDHSLSNWNELWIIKHMCLQGLSINNLSVSGKRNKVSFKPIEIALFLTMYPLGHLE